MSAMPRTVAVRGPQSDPPEAALGGDGSAAAAAGPPTRRCLRRQETGPPSQERPARPARGPDDAQRQEDSGQQTEEGVGDYRGAATRSFLPVQNRTPLQCIGVARQSTGFQGGGVLTQPLPPAEPPTL